MKYSRNSILPARAADDLRLTDGAWRLLAHIGRAGGVNGWCWLDDIAGAPPAAHWSAARLEARLGKLVSLGYVERRTVHRAGGNAVAVRVDVTRDEQSPPPASCVVVPLVPNNDDRGAGEGGELYNEMGELCGGPVANDDGGPGGAA